MLVWRSVSCLLAVLTILIGSGRSTRLVAPTLSESGDTSTGLNLTVSNSVPGAKYTFQPIGNDSNLLVPITTDEAWALITDCHTKKVAVFYTSNNSISNITEHPITSTVFTEKPPQPVIDAPIFESDSIKINISEPGPWYGKLSTFYTLVYPGDISTKTVKLPANSGILKLDKCSAKKITMNTETACKVKSDINEKPLDTVNAGCDAAPVVPAPTFTAAEGLKVTVTIPIAAAGATPVLVPVIGQELQKELTASSDGSFIVTDCRFTGLLAGYTSGEARSLYKYVDLATSELITVKPGAPNVEAKIENSTVKLNFTNPIWYSKLTNEYQIKTGITASVIIPIPSDGMTGTFELPECSFDILDVYAKTECEKQSAPKDITGSGTCRDPPNVNTAMKALRGLKVQILHFEGDTNIFTPVTATELLPSIIKKGKVTYFTNCAIKKVQVSTIKNDKPSLVFIEDVKEKMDTEPPPALTIDKADAFNCGYNVTMNIAKHWDNWTLQYILDAGKPVQLANTEPIYIPATNKKQDLVVIATNPCGRQSRSALKPLPGIGDRDAPELASCEIEESDRPVLESTSSGNPALQLPVDANPKIYKYTAEKTDGTTVEIFPDENNRLPLSCEYKGVKISTKDDTVSQTIKIEPIIVGQRPAEPTVTAAGQTITVDIMWFEEITKYQYKTDGPGYTNITSKTQLIPGRGTRNVTVRGVSPCDLPGLEHTIELNDAPTDGQSLHGVNSATVIVFATLILAFVAL